MFNVIPFGLLYMRQGLRPREWRLQPEVPLYKVWSGGSGSICAAGNNTLSALFLPHASNFTWAGCHGANMAEASSASPPP